MIKRVIRILCMLLCVTAGVLFMQKTVYAVPASPDSDWEGEEGKCRSHLVGEMVTLESLEESDEAAEQEQTGRAGSSAAETSGKMMASAKSKRKEIPLIVIVVGFSQPTGIFTEGIHYQAGFDWAETIFEGEKSLTQYYSNMSLGKFTFVPAKETSAYKKGGNYNTADAKNDGIIHVTLDMAHGAWTGKSTKASTQTEFQMVSQAFKAAGKYINFGKYDRNKDGKLGKNELAICFIAAGFEAAAAPKSLPYGATAYLWAHAWGLEDMKKNFNLSDPIPKSGGVKPDAFIVMSEIEKIVTKADGSAVAVQAGLGTVSHELGHYLGLPDLYDTTYSTRREWSEYGVGDLSLMADGPWGKDPDGNSAVYSLDVWSRYKLGWIKPITVSGNGTYKVTAQNYESEDPSVQVARITTARKNEYYLVENHLFTGWDEGMRNAFSLTLDSGKTYKSNGGVVIWHIDEEICKQYDDYQMVNSTDHRPGVMVLYPEREWNGKYTFIREYEKGSVSTYPFLESRILAGQYKKLAAGFYLPYYGDGSFADYLAGRYDSCIKFKYISGSGNSAKFKIKMDHTPAIDLEIENRKPATVKRAGSYEKVRYCSVCGQELKRVKCVQPKLPTGWKKKAGKKYYYDKTGKLSKGWKKISGKWYYFNKKGVMQTGWMKSGGKWYYLKKNGIMTVGWIKIGGKWYYMDSSGVMVTGSLWIGGKLYQFGGNGVCLNP